MTESQLYLSRVPLHALGRVSGDRAGRRPVDDPQRLHSEVMALFGQLPGETVRADSHILFRVDPPSGYQAATVLIRSAVEPRHSAEGLETRPESAPPKAGTHVAFRVSVNAVRRRTLPTEPGTDARRRVSLTPVPRDDDPNATGSTMTDWLSERFRGALSDCEILNHDRTVTGKQTTRIVQVDLIDGFGRVEDPARLSELLRHGVGRAKSYGCGLLTLRPIP